MPAAPNGWECHALGKWVWRREAESCHWWPAPPQTATTASGAAEHTTPCAVTRGAAWAGENSKPHAPGNKSSTVTSGAQRLLSREPTNFGEQPKHDSDSDYRCPNGSPSQQERNHVSETLLRVGDTGIEPLPPPQLFAHQSVVPYRPLLPALQRNDAHAPFANDHWVATSVHALAAATAALTRRARHRRGTPPPVDPIW